MQRKQYEERERLFLTNCQFRFGAMLCCNLGDTCSDEGHFEGSCGLHLASGHFGGNQRNCLRNLSYFSFLVEHD